MSLRRRSPPMDIAVRRRCATTSKKSVAIEQSDLRGLGRGYGVRRTNLRIEVVYRRRILWTQFGSMQVSAGFCEVDRVTDKVKQRSRRVWYSWRKYRG
jgi:hypothetical protein